MTSNAAGPHLLSLPLELKFKIFDLCQTGETGFWVVEEDGRPDQRTLSLVHYKAHPLAHVSQKVRNEYAAWEQSLFVNTLVWIDAHLLESLEGREPLVFGQYLMTQRDKQKEWKARRATIKQGLPIRKLELQLQRVVRQSNQVDWTVKVQITINPQDATFTVEREVGLTNLCTSQPRSVDKDKILESLEPGIRRMKSKINELVAVRKLTAFKFQHIEEIIDALSRPGVPASERLHPSVLWEPNAPEWQPPPPGGW